MPSIDRHHRPDVSSAQDEAYRTRQQQASPSLTQDYLFGKPNLPSSVPSPDGYGSMLPTTTGSYGAQPPRTWSVPDPVLFVPQTSRWPVAPQMCYSAAQYQRADATTSQAQGFMPSAMSYAQQQSSGSIPSGMLSPLPAQQSTVSEGSTAYCHRESPQFAVPGLPVGDMGTTSPMYGLLAHTPMSSMALNPIPLWAASSSSPAHLYTSPTPKSYHQGSSYPFLAPNNTSPQRDLSRLPDSCSVHPHKTSSSYSNVNILQSVPPPYDPSHEQPMSVSQHNPDNAKVKIHCPFDGCHTECTGKWAHGNMQRHIKQKHSEEGHLVVQCPECSKPFARGDALKKHLRGAHAK